MIRLVRFFIENHKLTIILTFGVLIFGLMGLLGLNAESYPNVNFAMATIETRYDGATASEIETKITKPIEDKIKEVSGLKDVRSISKTGFSSIFVRIDMDNEDEDQVLEDLQKAVDSVSDLPADLRDDPIYKEINSEEFPAIEIAIVGDNTNRARDVMADLMKEELEDIKSVLSVRAVGWRKRQFNVRLDRDLLQKFHIGIAEVTQKIRARNINVPGGDLTQESIKKLIRVEGKIQNRQELADILIRSNFSGQKVFLKDIAEIIDGQEDAKVLSSYNGKEATLLIVNKKAGSDTIKLVSQVEDVLEKFRSQYGDEFQIKIYNNEAKKVKNKLAVLSSNAVQGLALVIIFLLLFLPGKIGFVASLSLPIAVMATIGFMPPLGMNFDAITILALVIALGMLVDNSVVIAENYSRLRQDEGLGATEAAIVSVEQLWLPITCTAFTTIAAFLPMLVTTGIMGQFIKWIPIVVSISLIVSLGESFFFLPMRLKYAGRGTKISDEPQSDWFGKFIIKFENFMDKAIRYRYVASVAFGVVIIGAILLMGFGNKFILFPAEQTEIYLARVEMKKGTTVEETSKVVAELSLDIQEHMGDWVREVVERAGISSMGPTDPKGATGSNQGLLLIYASEFAKFNVPYTEFLEKIRKVEHPQIESLTYKEMVNGPPVGDPINATFRSNNTKSLDAMINHVKDELSEIAGIIDLQVDDIIGEDEVRLNIKYEKLDQLGLTVDDVGNAVRTALSGQVTSKVTLDNKEVDINVRFKDDFRKKLDHLGSVTVMDRMGNLVPIDQVADFAVSSGSVEIKRFDFKRSKTLLGSVELDKITSALANVKLQEVFEKYSKTYKDVSLVFGGEAESTKESMASLGKALFLSLIGIFALLVFLFRSYLRPFIIMTTIPLGLIGFSVAFFLHGRPISFLAMIGVIGLGGIIVNSGIVLLSFIDQLKEEGKLSDHEILVKASGLRLRAVVVSSLTTISGLIPTAYGIGGNDAMLVPMTLAMAWGLTSGTILTLVWVPCAYAILEDWNRFLLKTPLKFLAEKPKKHSQADGLSSQESIKVKTDPLNDKMQESLQ